MVYDSTVDFFGNAIVITTITGLHMKNRNLSSRSDDCGKGAVSVAEDQNFVGSVLGNYIVDSRENLTDLLAKCRRTHAEHNVRSAEFEIAKENIAEILVKILPC